MFLNLMVLFKVFFFFKSCFIVVLFNICFVFFKGCMIKCVFSFVVFKMVCFIFLWIGVFWVVIKCVFMFIFFVFIVSEVIKEWVFVILFEVKKGIFNFFVVWGNKIILGILFLLGWLLYLKLFIDIVL